METLKSSKSVGDLMSEIQKETDALILDTTPSGMSSRFVKQCTSSKPRQYSQTPPPETQNKNVAERLR